VPHSTLKEEAGSRERHRAQHSSTPRTKKPRKKKPKAENSDSLFERMAGTPQEDLFRVVIAHFWSFLFRLAQKVCGNFTKRF